MKKISFLATPKLREKDTILNIISFLAQKGISLQLDENFAKKIGKEELGVSEERLIDGIDMMISLGGDGTLLRAARLAAEREIPILGINIGGLGFLTEVPLSEYEKALLSIFENNYHIEERITLQCVVLKNGKPSRKFYGLNDTVIHRGGSSHLLHLQFFVNERYGGSFAADGIVVCTPTGSTAYALSTGGPIVSPEVDCFVINAICPHTLSARPLVISSEETIKIVETTGSHMGLSIDGQTTVSLDEKEEIIISKGSFNVKFIRIEKDFYQILREKLNWVE